MMGQADIFVHFAPAQKGLITAGGVPPDGRPGKSLVRVAVQNGFASSAAPLPGLYSGYSFKIATYRF
jgi:hypothetical protein